MKLSIAYLGPAGTFTEQALWEFVREQGWDPKQVTALPCTTPGEAIAALSTGADYACVAMENSVDGSVTPTFDAIAAHDGVQIYKELDLPIAFAVMVRPGVRLSDCHTLTTHPVAYQQVKGWLAEHFPQHEFLPASSNGAGAHMVAEEGADVAIAPARAAKLCELEILSDGVADVASARTRFVLVGKQGKPRPRTGADRTGVVFALRNEPGSLVGALTEFALRGVDLSRIEARPLEEGLGTYRFHVVVNGHIQDPPVAEALRALYPRCQQIQFIGSWPVSATSADAQRLLTRERPPLDQATAWVEQYL